MRIRYAHIAERTFRIISRDRRCDPGLARSAGRVLPVANANMLMTSAIIAISLHRSAARCVCSSTRRGLTALAAIIIVASCARDNVRKESAGSSYFDHAELSPVQLSGSLLSDAPSIARPLLLQPSGGILWVSDAASDPGLHALNADSGELLYSVGTRGNGPGEFASSPFGLAAAPADTEIGAVWAFDMQLQRLTRFKPLPLADYDIETIQLQGPPNAWRIAWAQPERIIAQSNSIGQRFGIFAIDGSRLQTVPGAVVGPADAPIAERLRATNESVRMCAWPKHGFALANAWFGQIEYYDLDARPVRTASVPYKSEPTFTHSDDGEVTFEPERHWYVGCAATTEHLYALFSGRRIAAYEGSTASSAEYMHVFGWDGDLVATYKFDHEISGIGISPSGETLYAASVVEGKIFRYDMPTIP